MCQKYQKLPDDSWFEDIDEYQWLWMYASWIQDQEDKHKFFKEYSTYVGAFSNPEMARNAIKNDNPDFATTDKEFEESFENISKMTTLYKPTKKRRRALSE